MSVVHTSACRAGHRREDIDLNRGALRCCGMALPVHIWAISRQPAVGNTTEDEDVLGVREPNSTYR